MNHKALLLKGRKKNISFPRELARTLSEPYLQDLKFERAQALLIQLPFGTWFIPVCDGPKVAD